MKRALVTGSEGFIGRHMVKRLREDGYEVTTVDTASDLPIDARDYFNEDYDPFALADGKFDLVVHLAAKVGGREGIDFDSIALGSHNAQLDGALFEWALRSRPGRIVYFSSAASYPNSLQREIVSTGELGLSEDLISVGDNALIGWPDDTYGWQKLTGEILANSYRQFGGTVSIVRPFSSYSEDQELCYPFPMFVKRAMQRDDPFEVWGDGEQCRDFIHIHDLVNAVMVMVEEGIDGPVNLGTGRSTSFNELAMMMTQEVGYEPEIKHLLHKPVGVMCRVSNNSLMRSFYDPKITLEEGVERAVLSERALELKSL